MNDSDRLSLIRNSIAISVGVLFSLLFLLLCYHRELGPGKPSGFLFGFVIGLGGISLTVGLIEAGGRPPAERGFGYALAIEGGLLIFLSLIAWTLMGPVPLPPQ